jgi:hypothetical protein
MNRKVTVTLEKSLKMYSNLKFEEKGVTSVKPGVTLTLEDTGKIHLDEEGKERKVFRLKKNTRNYYTLESLF